MGILFPYDLLYGVYATCSFPVHRKVQLIDAQKYLCIVPRLFKNHVLAQNTVKCFAKLQMQRLDSFWEEQLSPHEHGNKRDPPSTPSLGTSEVRMTAFLLANTCWSRGYRSRHLILSGWVCSQSLNGLSFEGERKNFKLTISNVIIADELVNSKKMIFYVWH